MPPPAKRSASSTPRPLSYPAPLWGRGEEPHFGAEGGAPAAGAPESEKNTPHPKLADRTGERGQRTARRAQAARRARLGLGTRVSRRASGCTARRAAEQ